MTQDGGAGGPVFRDLMAWNILEGLLDLGRRGDGAARAMDSARLAAAQALVRRLAPDYLVLNEALYCLPYAGRHVPFADLFGFPHHAAHLYDKEWGNAILSAHPIVEVVHALIHPGGAKQNRGALAVRVRPPAGPDVWIATLHPHPQRLPMKRAGDFLAFLDRLRGHPLILAGDKNAVSPDDEVDWGTLVDAFRRFSRPGDAERSVQRFLDAGRLLWKGVFPHYGLRDAVAPSGRRPTMPTSLLGGRQESAIRIDHVLVSPGIDVRSAGAVRDPLADAASDHYPVVVRYAAGAARGGSDAGRDDAVRCAGRDDA